MKATFSWQPAKTEKAKPCRKALNALIRRAAEASGLPVDGDWQAAVRFIADPAMARANEDYVGHTGTTDVITFSYFDDPDSIFPGDVAVELLICTDVARREGESREDSSFAEELALYISHGFLHASGEDDLTPGPRRRMRRREKEVMAILRQEFNLNQVFGVSQEDGSGGIGKD